MADVRQSVTSSDSPYALRKRLGREKTQHSQQVGNTEKDACVNDDASTKNPRVMDRNQFLAALSYVFIVLFLGVPVWWKTTGTYRANLPHGKITSFHDDISLRTVIPITLWVSSNRETAAIILSKIQALGDSVLKYDVRVVAIRPSLLGKLEAAEHLKQLDVPDLISTHNQEGLLHIVEVPSRLMEGNDVHVGRFRTIFISLDASSDSLSATLIPTISFMVGDAALRKETLRWNKGKEDVELDLEQLRRVRSHPRFNLVFSLVNPTPELVTADWTPELALQGYLHPFTKRLSRFADFTVTSQSLYLVPMPVKGEWNEALGCEVLTPEVLPHVITPFEAKLGSFTSTAPFLHFLLFLNTKKPLCISTSASPPYVRLQSNAFLSPRWGGIQIVNHNVSRSNATGSVTQQTQPPPNLKLEARQWMAPFVSQLRLLVGLKKQLIVPRVAWSRPDLSCLRDWEVDYLLRLRTIENIVQSTKALQALSDLFHKISNIVIRDEIAARVYSATDQLHNASRLHASALFTTAAFLASKQANHDSDEAFFDESLLELLYFPDDQKFAVYIPLFIPVGVPVVLSLRDLWLYWRKRSQKDSTTSTQPESMQVED